VSRWHTSRPFGIDYMSAIDWRLYPFLIGWRSKQITHWSDHK
jgi:hypothetical protein